MGQWALSPSQSARTPRSLADRLASEVRTGSSRGGKAGGRGDRVVDGRALRPRGAEGLRRRCRPASARADRNHAAGPPSPRGTPSVNPLGPRRARRRVAHSGGIAAHAALAGRDRACRSGAARRPQPSTSRRQAGAQQASARRHASIPPDTARPEPDIALTAPVKLVAKAGEEIAFDVTLDTDEVLPSRSVIAIRALPDGRHLLARPSLWRERMEPKAG